MNLKEEALKFAIDAHKGQVRKGSPELPYIIHPLGVADLLECYGYNDDELIAAAYLHDTVEDTDASLLEIYKLFGYNIYNIVRLVTEEDKSLSWEIRKQEKINNTKNLPLNIKLLVCADKINNLEDMIINSHKTGKKDFSKFKRGENKQKWFYEEIYKSLIYNEDKDNPLFKRLENTINVMFYENIDITKKIDATKCELIKLRKLLNKNKFTPINYLKLSDKTANKIRKKYINEINKKYK